MRNHKFMKEQQEGYRPPVAETQIEEPEVSTVEEATIPSVEDLDALLRESENVATIASLSEKEIDEMVERRQESLERLRDVDTIRESRLQKVENYNPLGDLESSDYERLVKEEMIDPEYADRMKKLDAVISKLESLDYPSVDAKAELDKLSEIRNTFREKIESQIEERQQEIAARREEVKSKVLEHYAKRVEELERTIMEIESNPRVLERLQTMAEEERRAFEAKIEKERQAILQEAARYIQSLGSRHGNAFKRLGEIVGDEKIGEALVQVMTEGDLKKQQSTFDSVRSRLINAIIDGEGKKQLKNPAEIVPWRGGSTTIRYGDAIDFLRFHGTKQALQVAAETGNEQAKKFLAERDQIITSNEVIRKIVGPQWVTDRKTGQKRMTAFWAAFETRKKNDEGGITEARKKEREEAAKREAEFKKSIKGIIERGGFVVDVPVVKKIRGRNVVVGKEKGAVRLEKAVSKKGNEYWKVVEAFGAATNGLEVGNTSPLDMRSFPVWLGESAKPYFVMRGKDFDERLMYESEE